MLSFGSMKSQECGSWKMGGLFINKSIILNMFLLNNLGKLDANLFATYMFQKCSFWCMTPCNLGSFCSHHRWWPIFPCKWSHSSHVCCAQIHHGCRIFFHLMVQLSKQFEESTTSNEAIYHLFSPKLEL